ALTSVDLAVTLNVQEKYDEAEQLFRTAVKTLRQRLGERHPLTVQASSNLGGNLYYQGKYAEAEAIHKAALAVYQELFCPQHPKTAWAYKNLNIDLCVQGKYAESEKIATAAAESFEGARRQSGVAGLERTEFAAENSPLPLLAAVAARNGKPDAACRFLENNLARGLFDELSARQGTDEERQREGKLSGQIDQLDNQISELLGTPNVAESSRQKAVELARQRDQRQLELSQLRADLTRKYGVAGGEIYDLARIQSQLPADAALVTWVDYDGQQKAGDPNGEHWTCVVRRTGSPIWVRLTGTGSDKAWPPGDDGVASRLRRESASRPTMADKGDDLARTLYTQRLAPLEKHLAASAGLPAVRQLIVLPSPHMRG